MNLGDIADCFITYEQEPEAFCEQKLRLLTQKVIHTVLENHEVSTHDTVISSNLPQTDTAQQDRNEEGTQGTLISSTGSSFPLNEATPASRFPRQCTEMDSSNHVNLNAIRQDEILQGQDMENRGEPKRTIQQNNYMEFKANDPLDNVYSFGKQLSQPLDMPHFVPGNEFLEFLMYQETIRDNGDKEEEEEEDSLNESYTDGSEDIRSANQIRTTDHRPDTYVLSSSKEPSDPFKNESASNPLRKLVNASSIPPVANPEHVISQPCLNTPSQVGKREKMVVEEEIEEFKGDNKISSIGPQVKVSLRKAENYQSEQFVSESKFGGRQADHREGDNFEKQKPYQKSSKQQKRTQIKEDLFKGPLKRTIEKQMINEQNLAYKAKKKTEEPEVLDRILDGQDINLKSDASKLHTVQQDIHLSFSSSQSGGSDFLNNQKNFKTMTAEQSSPGASTTLHTFAPFLQDTSATRMESHWTNQDSHGFGTKVEIYIPDFNSDNSSDDEEEICQDQGGKIKAKPYEPYDLKNWPKASMVGIREALIGYCKENNIAVCSEQTCKQDRCACNPEKQIFCLEFLWEQFQQLDVDSILKPLLKLLQAFNSRGRSWKALKSHFTIYIQEKGKYEILTTYRDLYLNLVSKRQGLEEFMNKSGMLASTREKYLKHPTRLRLSFENNVGSWIEDLKPKE